MQRAGADGEAAGAVEGGRGAGAVCAAATPLPEKVVTAPQFEEDRARAKFPLDFFSLLPKSRRRASLSCCEGLIVCCDRCAAAPAELSRKC